MANRHLSRSIAMQSLFEWDFAGKDSTAIDAIISRNADEFAPGGSDTAFIVSIVKGVLEFQEKIDAIIEHAAPEWPLDQISVVDRNILRIGLYELLYADRSEVPAKVAINEAIELAKTFGGESSGRFVNGVLGTVYKELGEPGKDETTKPKKKKRREDYTKEELEQLPLEQLAGALVYTRDGGEIFLALVHDVFGYWTLSKGGVHEGETPEAAAKRELNEEIGLDISIEETLGVNEYVASDPEKGKMRKRVTYYLASSPKTELALKETGGLDDAKWFSLIDIPGLEMYDDIRPLFTKAAEILAK